MPHRPSSDCNPNGAKNPKISILSILILSLFIGLIVGAGIDKSYILPVALIAAIILYIKRDKIAATDIQSPSNAQKHRSTENSYHWPELKQFSCPVHAEPYQKTIRKLIQENIAAPGPPSPTQTRIFTAQLIPDLNNPFDTDIIRVEIHQQTVGHLYGEQARRFRNQLKEKELGDQVTFCKTLIAIDNSAGDQPPYYSIMLDLALSE